MVSQIPRFMTSGSYRFDVMPSPPPPPPHSAQRAIVYADLQLPSDYIFHVCFIGPSIGRFCLRCHIIWSSSIIRIYLGTTYGCISIDAHLTNMGSLISPSLPCLLMSIHRWQNRGVAEWVLRSESVHINRYECKHYISIHWKQIIDMGQKDSA